jgi:hypothetical protein
MYCCHAFFIEWNSAILGNFFSSFFIPVLRHSYQCNAVPAMPTAFSDHCLIPLQLAGHSFD